VRLQIVYDNGQGVLRTILRVCGQRNWQLAELDADDGNLDRDQVGVSMTLSGAKISNAAQVLAQMEGVGCFQRRRRT
jgi:putative Mg2+ transporter-C (MgtC) family protein